MREMNQEQMTPVIVSTEDEDPFTIHPSIGRFVAAVDNDVEEFLSDDVVEARLASIRRDAIARAKTGAPAERGLIEELAAYGYTTVRTWLRIVQVGKQTAAAQIGQHVDLDDSEIDELAKDTAARALISIPDAYPDPRGRDGNRQANLRVAFLGECLSRLPEAHLSLLLRLGRLGGELEEWGQPTTRGQIVDALRYCVTGRFHETSRLLRTWVGSDSLADEIMTMTRAALDHTATGPGRDEPARSAPGGTGEPAMGVRGRTGRGSAS